jgi:putative transposase
VKQRAMMIKKDKTDLSVRRQCELLDVHRSRLYYVPVGESEENLKIMRLMDEHNLQHPTEGVLRMQDFLFALGFVVNHKRVRRLLRLMGIMAMYPKRNLSKLGKSKYVHPYLLRNLEITKANQVWAIDITYIPMAQGYMYLIAIIDHYSRYVVGWDITNSLAGIHCVNMLEESISRHGKPEIINSDQGSQFTCKEWIETLEKHDIRISMDGKGRAIDNIFIERLWRTVKQDYVYLNPATDGNELFQGLKSFFNYYNNEKTHQGINRKTPASLYKRAA